jgi:DNA mismatch repair protein MutS
MKIGFEDDLETNSNSSSSKIYFLYKIEEGVSDGSYGIHVARLAGIDEKIITRAQGLFQKLNK